MVFYRVVLTGDVCLSHWQLLLDTWDDKDDEGRDCDMTVTNAIRNNKAVIALHQHFYSSWIPENSSQYHSIVKKIPNCINTIGKG